MVEQLTIVAGGSDADMAATYEPAAGSGCCSTANAATPRVSTQGRLVMATVFQIGRIQARVSSLIGDRR